MIVSYLTMFPVHQPAGLVTSAISATTPSSTRSCNSTFGRHPHSQLTDFGFMHANFDLHFSDVGDHQQRLLFANHGPFFDVGRFFPLGGRREDHHSLRLGPDHAVFQLFLVTFEAIFLKLE